MSTVIINGRQSSANSLARIVARMIKEEKVKLKPGDTLEVSIRSDTSPWFPGPNIYVRRPRRLNPKNDTLFSKPIEELDFGREKQRWCKVLRAAGFQFIGQLARTWQKLEKISGVSSSLKKRVDSLLKQNIICFDEENWCRRCGPKELKSLRTLPLRDFLCEVKKMTLIKSTGILELEHAREELSELGMHTLGDALDAGYEKVREALKKLADKDGPWEGWPAKNGSLCYFEAFISTLSHFGLGLERKMPEPEPTELEDEPVDVPRNLQGEPFDF